MERAKSAKLFSLGALLEVVTICEFSPRARVLSFGVVAAVKALGSTGVASEAGVSVGASLAIGSGVGTLGSLCRLSAKLAKVNLSEWTSFAVAMVLFVSVATPLGVVGLGLFAA